MALAYVAANLIWTAVDPSTAGRDVMVRTSASAQTASTTFTYRVEGGGLDPFRLGAFATADVDLDDAPVSTLNLTVVGARVASAHDDGSAIIRTPNNAEHVYRPGDEIVDGVTLERVEAQRVLVRRQGAIEALPFARSELSVLSSAPAPRAPGGTIVSGLVSNSDPAPIENERPTDSVTEAPAPVRASTSTGNAVSSAALMRSVTPRPAPEGEEGVALYPRGDGAAFAAAGFEPGDVVTMVNGVVVADAARLSEVLSGLGDGAAVNVRVERGRETASLDFVLE